MHESQVDLLLDFKLGKCSRRTTVVLVKLVEELFKRLDYGSKETGACMVVNSLRFSIWPPTVVNCHCCLRLKKISC